MEFSSCSPDDFFDRDPESEDASLLYTEPGRRLLERFKFPGLGFIRCIVSMNGGICRENVAINLLYFICDSRVFLEELRKRAIGKYFKSGSDVDMEEAFTPGLMLRYLREELDLYADILDRISKEDRGKVLWLNDFDEFITKIVYRGYNCKRGFRFDLRENDVLGLLDMHHLYSPSKFN